MENREETPQKPCEVSSPKTTTSSTEEESIWKPGERLENKYKRNPGILGWLQTWPIIC